MSSNPQLSMPDSPLAHFVSLQEELHRLTAKKIELDDAARAADQRNHELRTDIQLLSNPTIPKWLSPPVSKRDVAAFLAELRRALELAKKVRFGLTALRLPTSFPLQEQSQLKSARANLKCAREELEKFQTDTVRQTMVRSALHA